MACAVGMLVAGVSGTASPAPSPTARGTARLGVAVTIDYGRPSARGLSELAAQAQPGFVWRLGCGAPTTLVTDRELLFGQSRLQRGTYVLDVKKASDGQWQLRALDPEGGVRLQVSLHEEAGRRGLEFFTIELRQKGASAELIFHVDGKSFRTAFTAH